MTKPVSKYDLSTLYAKKVAQDMDIALFAVFVAHPSNRPAKLTRKQKIILRLKCLTLRAMYYRYGEALTRWLMRKFDIYEGDY